MAILIIVLIVFVLIVWLYIKDKNVKKLKELISALEVYARVDVLTGLYNRRHLEENFTAILRNASQGDNGNLSIIFGDVDNFKHYNDTYGHHVGDKCLKTIAGALMSFLRRPTDLATRYGGEEIVIVFPSANFDWIQKKAEAMRQKIAQLENGYEPITISLGVLTIIGFDSKTSQKITGKRIPEIFKEMIKRADELMYQAKENGRDQVVSSKITIEEILA